MSSLIKNQLIVHHNTSYTISNIFNMHGQCWRRGGGITHKKYEKNLPFKDAVASTVCDFVFVPPI